MKFDIYTRFQVEVRRESNAWVVYRSGLGKCSRLHDLLIPFQLTEDEIAVYLDDIFHEYAGPGQEIRCLPD